MGKEKTLYRKSRDIIEANPELLISFKTDSTIYDRKGFRTFAKGEQFIWILRECGTNVFAFPQHLIRLNYNLGEIGDPIQKAIKWNLESLKSKRSPNTTKRSLIINLTQPQYDRRMPTRLRGFRSARTSDCNR